MSKRHQASRRRTYGRRLHEVRERRDRPWNADDVERDLVEEGLAPSEAAVADYRSSAYGATWVGLE
jgi:hypothetical protein